MRDGRTHTIANQLEELRPLLLNAGDDNVTAAVKRYDAAVLAMHHGPRHQQREQAAEAALHAEIRTAAAERRAPVLDRSTVDAARAADGDEALYIQALRDETARQADALQRAVFNGAARLLHVLAVEYHRARPRKLPTGQTLACPPHLETLWAAIGWPPLAEGAGEMRVDPSDTSQFTMSYRAVMWWPVPIPGAWHGRNELRESWYLHVLEQLARPRRKGYSIDPNGELHLRERWRPPYGRLYHRDDLPARQADGLPVWIGGTDGVAQPGQSPGGNGADDAATAAELYEAGAIDLTELNRRAAAVGSAAVDRLHEQQRARRASRS